MSNDIRTLADVQPGGRVRLGDRNDALAASLRQIADAQYTRRQRFNGRLPADVQEVIRMAADALTNKPQCITDAYELGMRDGQALSAQPCPGGQDVLREAAEFARRVLAEIYATYQVKIGPFASQAQLANVKLGAALAARQPVGEPLARVDVLDGYATATWLSPFPDVKQGQLLYTAPPAQAVDLGRWSQRYADDLHVAVHTALSVHAGSLSQKKRAAISAYVKRMLIDSKAVGNG